MPKKFIYKINNIENFNCILNSSRCIATGKNGLRCKKRSIIGFEYCCIHLLLVKHLKIKPSLIPNSGNGLFVVDKQRQPNDIIFRPNDLICDYNGELINNNTKQARYANHNSPYAVQISNNNIIDCACKRGVGSVINTNPGHNNAKFSVSNQNHNPTAKIKASKNIRNNSEIYLAYGNAFNLNDGSSHITKNCR